MTFQVAVTLFILVATLVALATQRLRSDVVALCALLALILTGILEPLEAFSGFGQPVIVIIASIYVLGAALYETGVATVIADRLSLIGDRGPVVLLVVIMVTAGMLSAVLSGLLVIAILMPAVIVLARRIRLAPAQFLLPLVAGATMGSLLTTIGTVSNVVVSDLLAASGHGPLGFFTLTPYGLVSLVLALLWYLIVGRKTLRSDAPPEPKRPTLDEVEQAYRLDEQLYRLRVRSASDFLGQRLDQTELSTVFSLNVLAVQQGDTTLKPASPDCILDQNDILVVEGARGDILQAASLHQLEPKGAVSLEEFNLHEQDALRLAELMVPRRSRWVGRTLADIHFRERYGLNVLAVHRQGRAIREDLAELALDAGDTMLVQGNVNPIRWAKRDLNLVVVTHLGPQPGETVTRKAPLAVIVLVAMVIGVASGLVSLATASLAAALILVLTGCISVNKAYRSVDGRVIVLVGAMLPLAMALEKTGTAKWLADQLATLSPSIGPVGTLLLLYLFTAMITQVISNMATAALITPIAINLAVAQGLSPQASAIAIAIAVTVSYITPLSNADNLLIREAGGYKMRDYVVNGLPIFLLQSAAVLVILLVT